MIPELAKTTSDGDTHVTLKESGKHPGIKADVLSLNLYTRKNVRNEGSYWDHPTTRVSGIRKRWRVGDSTGAAITFGVRCWDRGKYDTDMRTGDAVVYLEDRRGHLAVSPKLWGTFEKDTCYRLMSVQSAGQSIGRSLGLEGH
jgi:hypothetical protein